MTSRVYTEELKSVSVEEKYVPRLAPLIDVHNLLATALWPGRPWK